MLGYIANAEEVICRQEIKIMLSGNNVANSSTKCSTLSDMLVVVMEVNRALALMLFTVPTKYSRGIDCPRFNVAIPDFLVT